MGPGRSATALVTLPSRAGFRRRFHPAVTRLARRSVLPGGMTSRPALLVDVCNQNSLRAQPRIVRTPEQPAGSTHPARAGLGAKLPMRWRPHRSNGPPVRVRPGVQPSLVWRMSSRSHARLETVFCLASAEVSRVRGWRALADLRLSSGSLTPSGGQVPSGPHAGRCPVTRLCPNSIRSDTSCRAIAAVPVGVPAS